jgi:hypothetical protein
MARPDARVLVLVPTLMILGACGGDPEPASPPPAAPSSAAPAPAPSAAEPEPSDSVYVEEDPDEPDPTPEPGDLSDEAQSYLDQALSIELGAVESAPKATAAQKHATLDKLPENPTQVLAALRDYRWLSPEAKRLYDRAVAASR